VYVHENKEANLGVLDFVVNWRYHRIRITVAGMFRRRLIRTVFSTRDRNFYFTIQQSRQATSKRERERDQNDLALDWSVLPVDWSP